MSSTAPSVPSRAKVVIIGGGIAGCSIAYHLAKMGEPDVVLIERKTLTCGTTWHAAGIVGQLRSSKAQTDLAIYTTRLFRELEEETGQPTGYIENGSLGLALSEARDEDVRRSVSRAKYAGVEAQYLSPAEIAERFPYVFTDDLRGAYFVPGNGQVNPVDVTNALAKGARNRGVRIIENLKADRIIIRNGVAKGVETAAGTIEADTVILCGGMWTRDFADAHGVSVPLQAAEHFYIVTEAIPNLPKNFPVISSVEEHNYFKEDAGKLLVGAFEPKAKPWGLKGIPEDFCFDSLPEDFDHFAPILESAVARIPLLQTAGIQLFFNGPESFTPDNRHYLGETPEVKNLFVAAGFNSNGILSSGGVGKITAEWVINRRPSVSMQALDIRRMMPFMSNKSYLADRTVETLGLTLSTHLPAKQMTTARGTRRLPLHDRLIAAGAAMGERSGWEQPMFYGEPGSTPKFEYSFHRPGWFENSKAESLAIQNKVALIDNSNFSKYIVEGPDSLAALEHICAARIDRPVGSLVYTQWLNEAGGIEADVTVTRLAETKFMVLTGGPMQVRDFNWMTRNFPEGLAVWAYDVTNAWSMLSIMGPNSRELLSRISPNSFATSDFPFGTSKWIELGYAKVIANRLTYVGELGWELLIPVEFTLHVYEKLLEAGADLGLTHAGHFAVDSCRMEKAYRRWGHDIDEDGTPIEAGLKFAVDFDKPAFIGRDALLAQREKGKIRQRLVLFRLTQDDENTPMLHHGEPIFLGDRCVGAITSGAWGHRLGASLGIGYVSDADNVSAEMIKAGGFEIEVALKRYPAIAQLQPFYDPKSDRVRA
jgi:4-methylaminobutanoate oxidase (formaldehyde-forming)